MPAVSAKRCDLEGAVSHLSHRLGDEAGERRGRPGSAGLGAAVSLAGPSTRAPSRRRRHVPWPRPMTTRPRRRPDAPVRESGSMITIPSSTPSPRAGAGRVAGEASFQRAGAPRSSDAASRRSAAPRSRRRRRAARVDHGKTRPRPARALDPEPAAGAAAGPRDSTARSRPRTP